MLRKSKPYFICNAVAAAGLLLLFALLVYFSVDAILRANKQLVDTTELRGPLEAVQIRWRYKRGYHCHLEFKVAGYSALPAVAMASERQAQQIIKKCAVGEPMIIHYEPTTTVNTIENEVPNFNVYQIQAGNSIIYSLAEAHHRAAGVAWSFGAFTIAFVVMMLAIFYVYEYKKL